MHYSVNKYFRLNIANCKILFLYHTRLLGTGCVNKSGKVETYFPNIFFKSFHRSLVFIFIYFRHTSTVYRWSNSINANCQMQDIIQLRTLWLYTLLSIINKSGLKETGMTWTCRWADGERELIQDLRGKIFWKTSSWKMENWVIFNKGVTRLPLLKLQYEFTKT
jgi:hypothetical protein